MPKFIIALIQRFVMAEGVDSTNWKAKLNYILPILMVMAITFIVYVIFDRGYKLYGTLTTNELQAKVDIIHEREEVIAQLRDINTTLKTSLIDKRLESQTYLQQYREIKVQLNTTSAQCEVLRKQYQELRAQSNEDKTRIASLETQLTQLRKY